ncbi:hypothetical protein M2139_002858 [Enterococcus sp. PF1-24]|uniref:hypothetical protein n=1 Tax=Enterococcus sp. PF1-24 TaxID=1742399 RepID=UPI0024736DC7|nr:hypothetical protein [Enterococcus sp. PF1-24]MDH6365833.1 hypothetical protein [Enterococcus sp. PFB1-1]MDH6402928.1 hypothetical protein [Enterococcus sp. PF1-24]
MRKHILGIVSVCCLVGSIITPGITVLAAEANIEAGSVVIEDTLEPGVSIREDVDGSFVVTKSDNKARVYVSKWGSWNYTNIAVTTGVAANAINAAFYAGLGASVAMFGIPGWVIGGLLTAASWTELGSSPGVAVADNWDKNNNGWIGFYMRSGYDAAGRVVATEYKTE